MTETSDTYKQALAELRQQIDAIDSKLLALMNQRATCAQDVAEIKRGMGEVQTFYRPEREAQVLSSIQSKNDGPLYDETVALLFRELMSACLSLEKPLTVAFLGPEGTFSQEAAQKHFGHAMAIAPMASFHDVFHHVETRQAHFGVVPVENSTEGGVNRALDELVNTPLTLCGEVELKIHHHVLIAPQTRPENVKIIFSHPQSFAQCREWLDIHMPDAKRQEVSSNSEAARLASNHPQAVAIAGEMAAEKYGLNKLHQAIEDQPDNATRFVVIGDQHVAPSGQDKTSVLVSMRNESGALYKLLSCFNQEGISMTRLESRPSKEGTWHYLFYIDFEGHVEDAPVKRAMAAVEQCSERLKWLGSYPRAVI